MERPDLDGLRLAQRGAPDVWLVFDGRRHRVASPSVYVSLFGDENSNIVFDQAMEVIDPGPELNDGTCLVRTFGSSQIFFVTGPSSKVRRMLVSDYESFLDFGFDMAKVADVPSLIVESLPQSKMLISAGSRTKIHAFSVSTAVPLINTLI